MTHLNPPLNPLKSLSFQRQKFALQDSEGNSISLAGLNENWESLPWKEAEISSIDLGDLPCRLSRPALALALQKIWHISADEALVKLHIPHPRHDVFLQDLGYVSALLPETFTTGLVNQLKIRFEMREIAFSFDPHWQAALDEKKITFEDIQVIAKQASNVIEWMDVQLQVKKSLWVQTTSSPLTAAMKQQLQDQLQAHTARGDEKAAAVIRDFLRNFLEKSPL